MGLDDGLLNAEDRRAADGVRVELRLEFLETALQDEGRDFGHGGLHHDLFDVREERESHAFVGLEEDIAGEAVADDDVGHTGRDVSGFGIADEVDMFILLEQRVRVLLQFRTLVRLDADVEKPDLRVVHAHDFVHVDRAHEGERVEGFRRDFDVRAAVDEHEVALVTGHDGGDGGAAHAFDALHDEDGADDQGSGGAGRHQCIASALRESAAGHAEGTVLVLFEKAAGVFLDRDEPVRGLDVHAGQVDVILFCAGADLLLVSAKQNVTAEFVLRRDRALQDLEGGIVAAERVNDDSHK